MLDVAVLRAPVHEVDYSRGAFTAAQESFSSAARELETEGLGGSAERAAASRETTQEIPSCGCSACRDI